MIIMEQNSTSDFIFMWLYFVLKFLFLIPFNLWHVLENIVQFLRECMSSFRQSGNITNEIHE